MSKPGLDGAVRSLVRTAGGPPPAAALPGGGRAGLHTAWLRPVASDGHFRTHSVDGMRLKLTAGARSAVGGIALRWAGPSLRPERPGQSSRGQRPQAAFFTARRVRRT